MAPIPCLLAFFDHLAELGPPYGYFPEKSKSILIFHLGRNKRTTKQTASHSFQVTNGVRYIGGYIVDCTNQTEWVQQKVEK